MARDPTAQWVVIYDADCGFCRWSLAQLLRLDRSVRLRPLALGTAAADALLDDLRPEQRVASWHLISPDGERTSAGLAAVPLLRLLPGGRLPSAALGAAPRLTERAYRWVADHRSLIGRLIPQRAKEQADRRIATRTAALTQPRASAGARLARASGPAP